MNKRILPPAEWETARMTSGKTLPEVFAEQGGELPDPLFAEMHVIEIDGKIAALGVLQLVPHLDPVAVDETYQGNPLGLGLAVVQMIEARLKESDGNGYFVFVNNEVVEGMCRRIGFEDYPSKVMFKEIEG